MWGLRIILAGFFRSFFTVLANPVEQFLDPASRARILFKMQLGDSKHPQAAGKLPPQIVPGGLERFQRLQALVFIATYHHHDVGVAQIRHHVNLADRHVRQPGVRHLEPYQFRQLFAQRLGDAFRAVQIHLLFQPFHGSVDQFRSQQRGSLLLDGLEHPRGVAVIV
jgi:hypothetical protein